MSDQKGFVHPMKIILDNFVGTVPSWKFSESDITDWIKANNVTHNELIFIQEVLFAGESWWYEFFVEGYYQIYLEQIRPLYQNFEKQAQFSLIPTRYKQGRF